MLRLLLVCLAGAAGTGARYGSQLLGLRIFGPGFPYGTLFVNVVGSFILSAVMVLGGNAGYLSPTTRAVLGAGLCGGFTTYSSFNFETMALFQEGAAGLAMLNIAVTLVVCMAAGVAGWSLTTWAVGR